MNPPQYKPLLVSHSRMMSTQNGRVARLRTEKNKEITEYNAKLKTEYESSLEKKTD